jgi:predicted RNase H-like HicB family nuclease
MPAIMLNSITRKHHRQKDVRNTSKQPMKTHDPEALAGRYLKIVEWSDEDQCYVGKCPALFFGGVHGSDEADVYKRLVDAVVDVLEGKIEKGEPLRTPTAGKKLHR